MKRYMRIKQYCKETGFPEERMRQMCRSYKAYKFCKRTGEAVNSHYIITVPIFEEMWDRGELDECL